MTQMPAVYSELTVSQNLEYFAHIVGASKDEVYTIINTVDLE